MAEKGIFDDIEEAAEAEAGSGPNFGIIILALGVIIILAVVAIKFTASGPTDEFMGIVNPEGVYGEYFLSGIVGGIVVAGIGGVLSLKGKPVEDYDIYEEEEVLADEEEEGICPTCGAVIPITSIECPECGEELEPMDEEEEDIPGASVAGDNIECPICAAMVDSTTTECPECGEPLGGEKGEDDDFFADL